MRSETYTEGVVQLAEDGLLVLDVVDVLALDDLVLLHRLDGELLGGVGAEPADLDQAEGTFAQGLAKDHISRLNVVEFTHWSRCCLHHSSLEMKK